MSITLAVSIVVCLVGLVVYLLAAPAKPAQLGLVAFGCGLLAALFTVGGAVSITTL